jgi:hypothetical protein
MSASKTTWCWLPIYGLVASLTSHAATLTTTEPFLGVQLIHDVRTTADAPYFRPVNIYVAVIDLSAPGLGFMVTPVGPDPRPIGSNPGFAGQPMETIRQTTRQFVDSTGAQVGINTSFFSAQTISGVNWANDIGLTASNGNAYSPWEADSEVNFRDALNILQSNQAFFVKRATSIPSGFETIPTTTLYNTITGQYRLIQVGNVRPDLPSSSPDPLTAVGLNATNTKMIMVAVDGRQAFSQGLTIIEMANYLKNNYGATNAVSFDGGGSTTMVMNFFGDGQATQVLNSPSDGPERSVGVNLGVFALPNGDYNVNGGYDAADYVNWRKSIGGDMAYAAWRKKFGTLSAGGSGLALEASVPEPSPLTLLAIFLYGQLLIRHLKRPTAMAISILPPELLDKECGRSHN